MTHNRECPKCGTVCPWKYADKRENITMPNGEVITHLPILGVWCESCKLLFEPRSHDVLRKKMGRVFA